MSSPCKSSCCSLTWENPWASKPMFEGRGEIESFPHVIDTDRSECFLGGECDSRSRLTTYKKLVFERVGSLLTVGPLSRKKSTSIRPETALYRTQSSSADPMRGDGIRALSIALSLACANDCGRLHNFRARSREDSARGLYIVPEDRCLREEMLKDVIARTLVGVVESPWCARNDAFYMFSRSRQAKSNHLSLLDKDITRVDKAILCIHFE